MTNGVYLSCGHQDPKKPFGWSLNLLELNEFNEKSVSHRSLCTSCVIKEIIENPDTVFFEWADAYDALGTWG